ncbi:MAG: hypothetical protein ABWY23_05785 [Mycetocola sp.]
MDRRNRKRVLAPALVLVAGIVAGATLPTVVVPTFASWLDRGGTSITLNAVVAPPPNPVAPIVPRTGPTATIFDLPPVWTPTSPHNFCFDVDVRTTSSTPAAWAIELHTGQPPFDNSAPFAGFVGQLIGDYDFTPASDYATTGDILATPKRPDQYASATVPYPVRICAVNTPIPAWQPPGPTTYTQLEPMTLVLNGSQPCVVATVQGHRPYYVGFTVAFNWSDFLDTQPITPEQKALWLGYRHWDGQAPPPTASQASTGATGTDNYVTLQAYNPDVRSVSSLAPVTLSSCAY